MGTPSRAWRDRPRHEVAERQLAPERGGELARDFPAADRAGNGQRRHRPPRRHAADRFVGGDRRLLAGEAAGFDGPHRASWVTDDPEAVAADGVHVRIDDGDAGGHRDHRLDSVPALQQDFAAGLGRQPVRRGDGGVCEEGVLGHSCGFLCRAGAAIGRRASSRKGRSVAASRPINWINAMTLLSVAVLVGTELVGAGAAAGWAIGGLFQLGELITHTLEAALVLLALTALYYFLRAALAHEPIRG